MKSSLHDLRFGLRLLARQRPIVGAAILTLALGLGAATTVFSVVDAILLRPLPFPGPGSLLMLWERHPERPGDWRLTSAATYADWRLALDGVVDLAISEPWRPVLDAGAELRSLPGARVSPDFFAVLGIEPLYGRSFEADDASAGGARILLTYRAWQRRFGGDPQLVGRSVRLLGGGGSSLATVIGILPPEAHLAAPMVLGEVEVLAPLDTDPRRRPRGERLARVIGRLRPGAELEQARQRLAAVSRRLAAAYPDSHRDWAAAAAPLVELMTAPLKPALYQLTAGAALLFAIACADVAILLLALANVRQRELALRSAAGAAPLRLARQLAGEGLLLAALAAGGGWLLAHGGLHALTAGLDLAVLPRGEGVALDHRVLLFTAGASLATALVFGLLPAVHATRLPLAALLARNVAGAAARRRGGLRHLLVIVQIALSALLLVLAGMTLTGYRQLLRIDPGFDAARVLTLRLQLPPATDVGEARIAELFRQLLARVDGLPEIEAAALTNQLPLKDGGMSTRAASRPVDEAGRSVQVELYGVTPAYFRVMGIPLRADDWPTPERPDGGLPIVLSARAAALLAPGEEVLGRSIYLDWQRPERPWRVVGIAGDVRHHGLAAAVRPAVYLPYRELPHRAMTLVARSSGEADAAAGVVHRAIRRLEQPLVIEEIEPLSEVVAESLAEPRLRAVLLAVFALAALLLAAAGTYSAMTYAVARRRHELGVRAALGARPMQLLAATWLAGLRLAAAGIALGVAAAWLVARFGAHLLPAAPAALGGLLALPLVLLGVAWIATHAAARRALRGDPRRVLRTF